MFFSHVEQQHGEKLVNNIWIISYNKSYSFFEPFRSTVICVVFFITYKDFETEWKEKVGH